MTFLSRFNLPRNETWTFKIDYGENKVIWYISNLGITWNSVDLFSDNAASSERIKCRISICLLQQNVLENLLPCSYFPSVMPQDTLRLRLKSLECNKKSRKRIPRNLQLLLLVHKIEKCKMYIFYLNIFSFFTFCIALARYYKKTFRNIL